VEDGLIEVGRVKEEPKRGSMGEERFNSTENDVKCQHQFEKQLEIYRKVAKMRKRGAGVLGQAGKFYVQ
jgi:hypothetical protein